MHLKFYYFAEIRRSQDWSTGQETWMLLNSMHLLISSQWWIEELSESLDFVGKLWMISQFSSEEWQSYNDIQACSTDRVKLKNICNDNIGEESEGQADPGQQQDCDWDCEGRGDWEKMLGDDETHQTTLHLGLHQLPWDNQS